MIWAKATALMLAPLVLVGLTLLAYKYLRTVKLITRLSTPKNRSALFKNFSLTKTVIQSLCVGAALTLILLALMRPQTPDAAPQTHEEQGRDVVIALDISRSMLAQDLQPNRLACAKQKIMDVVNALGTDRVGLIVFSGAALVQCPLTKDFEAFKLFLDALDAESVSSGSTALDRALTVAIDLFKNNNKERKSKLLVIFTDGEDFSQNLETVKQEAQALRLSVCTVGVGTPQGAPIPLFDEMGHMQGYQKDKVGTVVMSRLNEQILADIAKSLSGHYVRIQEHASDDVVNLVNWINQFEKEHFASAEITTYQEYFMYFSGLAFLLMLIEWIL